MVSCLQANTYGSIITGTAVSESNEAPATQVLRPEQVASFISWFVASPPEFVLTEGIVLPIEEGLP